MERIRVGIVSWTATYWPFFVGIQEGVFREYDLEIELVALGSTRAGVAALLEERVDIAATCPDALVEAVAEGAPLRIAGGLVNRPVSSLMVAPHITSYSGLRGGRVAVTEPRGSVSLLLRAVLRRHGLGPGDYHLVVRGTTPAQAEALEQGEVDVAMLTHPFESRLLAGGFRRLGRVGDELGPCAFTTLNVRRGWTERPMWESLRSALEAVDRLLHSPECRTRVMEALAEASGVGREAVEEAYVLYIGQGGVLARGGRLDLDGLERLLEIMRQEGLAAGPFGSAPSYLDTRALFVGQACPEP